MITPTDRLLDAWNALVAEVSAEGLTIDTSAIVAPGARRVAQVDPPRTYEVLLHAGSPS